MYPTVDTRRVNDVVHSRCIPLVLRLDRDEPIFLSFIEVFLIYDGSLEASFFIREQDEVPL